MKLPFFGLHFVLPFLDLQLTLENFFVIFAVLCEGHFIVHPLSVHLNWTSAENL